MPPEPAPRSGHPARDDYGLFGPASVTWRVMAEPVLWAAAFRALYLATTATLRALHAGTSHGPGDRLILPATRAARDQARAFQRARSARHLTAVP